MEFEIPQNLVQGLVARYKDNELPCFSDTLIKLSNLDPESDSAFEDLSNIILEDMGLTGKVIRMVNSVYYRRSGLEVTTVTQALVLLGFDSVREIALNMAVLDLAEKSKNDQLVSLILSSFTAAFFVQGIIDPDEDRDGESLFVSCLFHSLGRLILCLYQRQMYAALVASEFSDGKYRKKLKMLFMEIGKAFGELWGLPNFILNKMEGFPSDRDPILRIIEYSHTTIRAALFARDSSVVSSNIKEISDIVSVRAETLAQNISAALHSAYDLSLAFRNTFGEKEIKNVLRKLSKSVAVDFKKGDSGLQDPGAEATFDYIQLVSQLTGTIASQHFRLEEVYLFAAEALLRGVPSDRVILGLLNMDRSILRPRYVIGSASNTIKEQLIIVFEREKSAISRAFEKNQIRILEWKHILDYLQIDGKEKAPDLQGQVCLAPIIVASRPVGAFLIDRPTSKRPFEKSEILKIKNIRDLVVLATLNRR